MRIPTNKEIALTLLLHAASEGREELLFGDCFERVKKVLPDFLQTDSFPGIYLECPLLGDPFLDVTLLYSQMNTNRIQISSPAAEGTQERIQWFLSLPGKYRRVAFGYELDTKADKLAAAGVHFQPMEHLELVEPFCESLGEKWRARLYLDMAERVQKFWPLSYFGLFRGRPQSPLRVCGYLGKEERTASVKDPERIIKMFQAAGFTAYDDTMVSQICALLDAAPRTADFQFDVYPDGSCGNIFSVEAGFLLKPVSVAEASFRDGKNRELMRLLENWGISDDRWKKIVEMSVVRSLPVETEDGEKRKYIYVLAPFWNKVRWIDKKMQPAKSYILAKAWLI